MLAATEGLDTAEDRGFTEGLGAGATEGLEVDKEGLEVDKEGLEARWTGFKPMVLKRRVVCGLCVSTKEPKLSRGGSLSRGAAPACRRATVA